MEPLKIFYYQETEIQLRSNLGRGAATAYQIGEQFGSTYKPAATGKIAANGFRATGLREFKDLTYTYL